MKEIIEFRTESGERIQLSYDLYEDKYEFKNVMYVENQYELFSGDLESLKRAAYSVLAWHGEKWKEAIGFIAGSSEDIQISAYDDKYEFRMGYEDNLYVIFSGDLNSLKQVFKRAMELWEKYFTPKRGEHKSDDL